MARKARVDISGGLYHVIARGNERGKIFREESDYCEFLSRVKVLLLGSSALLVQRGLSESLTGRFELHRIPHWSYSECQECFGLNLEDYLVFGGYPGAIPFNGDYARWGRYIRDSIVETVVGKDVLLMSPVQKPALLRQVLGVACAHPAKY
jgi:hypothetical protein